MKYKSQFPKVLAGLCLVLLLIPATHPQAAGNPPQPALCTVTGSVKGYRSIYRSAFTVTLFRDGTKTALKAKVMGPRYVIRNVPEGTYEIRGSGWYQPTNQVIVSAGDDQQVTCSNGHANSVTFQINSGEGE